MVPARSRAPSRPTSPCPARIWPEAALAGREDHEVDAAEVEPAHLLGGQQRVDAPRGSRRRAPGRSRTAPRCRGYRRRRARLAAGVEEPVRGQVDQSTLGEVPAERLLARAVPVRRSTTSPGWFSSVDPRHGLRLVQGLAEGGPARDQAAPVLARARVVADAAAPAPATSLATAAP